MKSRTLLHKGWVSVSTQVVTAHLDTMHLVSMQIAGWLRHGAGENACSTMTSKEWSWNMRYVFHPSMEQVVSETEVKSLSEQLSIASTHSIDKIKHILRIFQVDSSHTKVTQSSRHAACSLCSRPAICTETRRRYPAGCKMRCAETTLTLQKSFCKLDTLSDILPRV